MSPSLLAALLAAPAPGRAEGFTGSSARVTLHAVTMLYADVRDNEKIYWTGAGDLAVRSPSGVSTTLASGDDLLANEEGVWTFSLSEDQADGWDLTVRSASTGQLFAGRVFSYEWIITATSASSSAPLYQAFYVPVPTDAEKIDLDSGVGRWMKLDIQGLYGEGVHILANSQGLPGVHLSSAPVADVPIPAPTLRLYLGRSAQVPLAPSYPAAPKETSALSYEVEACPMVLIDALSATVSVSPSLPGLGMFICDIDGDGLFDMSAAGGDVVGGAATIPGGVRWTWRGEASTAGAFVAPGTYTCAGLAAVSSAHALVAHARVADPGVRWFEAEAETALGQQIHWNDAAVADGVALASGEAALLHSGPEGVHTGDGFPPADANENAHAWGHLAQDTGRGVDGWIDTWTQGALYPYGTHEILVRPADEDLDGDGRSNLVECTVDGTDPLVADSPPEDTGPGGDSGDVVDGGGVLGDFRGGALACAAAPGSAGGLGLAGLAVVVGAAARRRRR